MTTTTCENGVVAKGYSEDGVLHDLACKGGDSLPLTGADLTLIVVGGVLLLLVGFVLRRWGS